MQYVNLGRTGMRVSRVCLGMMSYGRHESREWALDEAAAEPIVRRAVEGGITFFDTADVYNGGQSEVLTGRLMRKLFAMREEYVVATKVWGRRCPARTDGGSRASTSWLRSTRRLQRLELDYVDLYQIHRWDSTTPIDETMEALHDVVKAGKARYIGASSMYAWQFAKAQSVAMHAVRLDAESLQPDLPRGGARDDPPVHRSGRRRDPLEPARAGTARRQPDARRGEADDPARRPTASATCSTSPSSTSPWSIVSTEVAGELGVSERAAWRSPGCCTSPESPPRSSARPSSSISRTRWRPSSSS